MKLKHNLAWLAMAMLIMAFLTGCGADEPKTKGSNDQATAQASAAAIKGNKAPVFKLMNLGGEEVTVEAKGKPYVINFWATWCPPCRAEMPDLTEFYAVNSEKVDFYAVNLQEEQALVAKFLEENNIKLPTLLDTKGITGDSYGVRAIPTTLVVDRNGVIVYRKTGAVTKSELEGIIAGL